MIVFLDFETTGLNPSTGAEPIEVAAVVTDDTFREVGTFEELLRPSGVEHWDPEARAMHERSGLLGLCSRWGRPMNDVGAELGARLALFPAPLHLAGNSVHFDRGFLRHFWPDVEAMFHHRHLDVSSVRMLAERVVPNAPQLPGEKPHRAMADVRRSIAELHHWTGVLQGATSFRF